jgi:HD superfamily phosphodiesterase
MMSRISCASGANARAIAAVEGGRLHVLAAASLLHDCVAVEKSSPLRSKASLLAAGRAAELLQRIGWSTEAISDVTHAIAAHSFPRGLRGGAAMTRSMRVIHLVPPWPFTIY